MPKLLWVDDQIEHLGAFVDALSARGFEVHTADSCGAGLELIEDEKFDIILADINMPERTGISLLREAEILQPQAALVALSSYLYRREYIEQLSTLEVPVEMMDKIIPAPTSPEFDGIFVQKLRSLIDGAPRLTISDQIKKLEDGAKRDPFKVTFQEWLSKPILERDMLVDEAYLRAKATIEKAFRDGCIWVFLCGSPDDIRASARSEKDILSDDELLKFARNRDAAPYHFSAAMGVEDLWGGDCSGQYNLKNYPTVTFSSDVDDMTIHFDTGNPTSFISYEHLRESGFVKDPVAFGRSVLFNHLYRYTCFSIDLMLVSQEEGGATKYVKVNGQAVRDWEQHPLAKNCNSNCDGKIASGLCHYRLGLIGRNLIIDNKIHLILDGENRRTLFK